MQPSPEVRSWLAVVARRLETAADLLHDVGMAHDDTARLLVLERDIYHVAMKVRARRFGLLPPTVDFRRALFVLQRAACHASRQVPDVVRFDVELVCAALAAIILDVFEVGAFAAKARLS